MNYIKQTLDAPCEIIWTLTLFVRRTWNACNRVSRPFEEKGRSEKVWKRMTKKVESGSVVSRKVCMEVQYLLQNQ